MALKVNSLGDASVVLLCPGVAVVDEEGHSLPSGASTSA